MRLKHKIALITGAGKGIGRAIALRLAQEGAVVVINDINTGLMIKVTKEIQSMGGESIGVRADVSIKKDIFEMVQKIIADYKRIDILVNNAGVTSFANIFDLSNKEWDRIFKVNIKGVFLCSKAIIPYMTERKEGKIINISSIAGKTGGMYAAHYVASKFAIIGFTQALAQELASYRINVNAICPGFIDTDMLVNFMKKQASFLGFKEDELRKSFMKQSGWNRLGTPQDVANLAVFLASSESDYMTGQAINICAAGEFH